MKFDINRLLNPDVYDHPVDDVKLVETHISWVLLTGTFAYKIKKPVNYGFLDFSTLEKRRDFCEQELRLNRRLAAEIYLDVVSISVSGDRLRISADGEVIEYAVKMLQFPQSRQLDHMLDSGELNLEHMNEIARMVARFHQAVEIADESMDYGSKSAVYRPVAENFIQISQHIDTSQYKDVLAELQQWNENEFARLGTVFAQRKRDGFIRECHGDMHLRNLVWLDKTGPIAFDCIEFNPELRWIDVISEVAFLVMDLQDRQQTQLANRFLNTYLEVTGDYAGLVLLRFYLCYRALVRAKVSALRLEQTTVTTQEKAGMTAEFSSYLELATGYTQVSPPKLILMRGVSASGKSMVSQALADALGAVRIRSDVERKRIFNIPASEKASGDVDTGIYTPQASERTYAELVDLASQIIAAGYSVIVDAAFLKPEQRGPFWALAKRYGITSVILETNASPNVLRQRITARTDDISDAHLAVLEHQLANWQPLNKDETRSLIVVDTEQALQIDSLLSQIGRV